MSSNFNNGNNRYNSNNYGNNNRNYSNNSHTQNNNYHNNSMNYNNNSYKNYNNSYNGSYNNSYEQNYQNDNYSNDDFEYSTNNDTTSTKPIKKKKKKWKIVLTVFLILLLAGAGGAWYLLHGLDATTGLKMKSGTNSKYAEREEGYKTFALLGFDYGDEEDPNPRTDTMMIASLNNKTGEIKLASIERDTFLYLPRYHESVTGRDFFDKINGAYNIPNADQKGKAESTVTALSTNYSLHVDGYVAVSFRALAKVVDALGGIEIKIPNGENGYDETHFPYLLNKYGEEAADQYGDDFEPIPEDSNGQTLTLNGYQALGYCRVRKATDNDIRMGKKLSYGAEGDYIRSERQREVISKILEKTKSSGVGKISDLMDVFKDSENIYTSLDLGDLTSLGEDAVKSGYKIADQRQYPLTPLPANGFGKSFYASTRDVQFTAQKTNPDNENEIPHIYANSLEQDVRDLHKFLYPDSQELTNKELTEVKKIDFVLSHIYARDAKDRTGYFVDPNLVSQFYNPKTSTDIGNDWDYNPDTDEISYKGQVQNSSNNTQNNTQTNTQTQNNTQNKTQTNTQNKKK